LLSEGLEHRAGKRPDISNDLEITVQELSPCGFREPNTGKVDFWVPAEWR